MLAEARRAQFLRHDVATGTRTMMQPASRVFWNESTLGESQVSLNLRHPEPGKQPPKQALLLMLMLAIADRYFRACPADGPVNLALGKLLRGDPGLAGIRCVLIHGRFDIGSPPERALAAPPSLAGLRPAPGPDRVPRRR
jgi:hypothetical protein